MRPAVVPFPCARREKELSIIAHGLQGTVFIDEDGNPAPDPTIPSPAVVAANAEAMLTAKAEAHKEVINFMEDEPEPEAGEEP